MHKREQPILMQPDSYHKLRSSQHLQPMRTLHPSNARRPRKRMGSDFHASHFRLVFSFIQVSNCNQTFRVLFPSFQAANQSLIYYK